MQFDGESVERKLTDYGAANWNYEEKIYIFIKLGKLMK